MRYYMENDDHRSEKSSDHNTKMEIIQSPFQMQSEKKILFWNKIFFKYLPLIKYE